MKILKSLMAEMVLPFITAWFLTTVLVDIVAIPTVFKNTSNLIEAGKIGMTVFGKFNCLEMVMALLILLGVFSMKQKSKLILSLSIVLLAFSLFYTFFMTPMIANTSLMLHQIAATDPQYQVLTKQHNTYHSLYRTFDTTKMLLLLVFGGILLTIKMKERV